MPTVLEIVAGLLDLAAKLIPNDDELKAHLDAAMIRRAQAAKATADDAAFGPKP